MVYHNAIRAQIGDNDYENATFRARHGYKEAHTPDTPYRRNRDFKPMQYGAYRGILNYRHSEPYCLLKNMKDLVNEDHNILIKTTKEAIRGAVIGGIIGAARFAGGNTSNFEMNKLLAAQG